MTLAISRPRKLAIHPKQMQKPNQFASMAGPPSSKFGTNKPHKFIPSGSQHRRLAYPFAVSNHLDDHKTHHHPESFLSQTS